MSNLNQRAFVGFFQLLLVMALLLFVPPWTLDFWQAWLFLAVFFACTLSITLYLMKHDPQLLERRVNAGPAAETRASQKVIQLIAAIAFIGIFIFSALDHRFSWSAIPTYVVAFGDVLVALGFLFIFFVFRENTFTSAIIEVGAGQKIITTGPYALVRHPMYFGALVMLVGVPLALGSWWGLLTIVPLAVVIVFRLLDEEKFLAQNLSGYSDYQVKVKHHLLPLIW